MFQKVAEQGHYAGRTKPTATRQGIYACAPSGVLLSSINTNDPVELAAMLDRALARWEELPPGERFLPEPETRKGNQVLRLEQLFPEDGLALRVVSRDVDREVLSEDWRGTSWNLDFAWFRKPEAQGFVPPALEPGQRHRVPGDLVRRLAQFHFVDNVRGQTPGYRPRDVEEAAVTSEVIEVTDGIVSLRFEGRARTRQRGNWPIAGYADMNRPSEQERGVDLRILGRAQWNPASGRFESFEWVCVGTRTGATQYNGRADDPGPAPIGFVLQLAGSSPADRVAPAHIWNYGWK